VFAARAISATSSTSRRTSRTAWSFPRAELPLDQAILTSVRIIAHNTARRDKRLGRRMPRATGPSLSRLDENEEAAGSPRPSARSMRTADYRDVASSTARMRSPRPGRRPPPASIPYLIVAACASTSGARSRPPGLSRLVVNPWTISPSGAGAAPSRGSARPPSTAGRERPRAVSRCWSQRGPSPDLTPRRGGPRDFGKLVAKLGDREAWPARPDRRGRGLVQISRRAQAERRPSRGAAREHRELVPLGGVHRHAGGRPGSGARPEAGTVTSRPSWIRGARADVDTLDEDAAGVTLMTLHRPRPRVPSLPHGMEEASPHSRSWTTRRSWRGAPLCYVASPGRQRSAVLCPHRRIQGYGVASLPFLLEFPRPDPPAQRGTREPVVRASPRAHASREPRTMTCLPRGAKLRHARWARTPRRHPARGADVIATVHFASSAASACRSSTRTSRALAWHVRSCRRHFCRRR